MPRTSTEFQQVDDTEFASQTELEQTQSNNEGGFVAATMNNVDLYNLIQSGFPKSPLVANMNYSAAQKSLTSTSWTDVAGASVSITTVAEGKIFAIATGATSCSGSGSGSEVEFRIVVADENGNEIIEEPYDDLERNVTVMHLTASKPAGTYTAQLQWRRLTGSLTIYTEDVSIVAMSLVSSKGDKGDTGSGSNITLQNNGTNVTNTPHSTLNFTGAVTVADGGNGVATVNVTSSIFGTYSAQAESLGLSTTTSQTMQNKVTLSTGTIPAGTYRVGWSFDWGYTSTNANFYSQVQVDDTTTLMTHVQEPKDNTSSQRHPVGGFGYVTLTGGTHTIDLDYRSGNAGATARIQDARLEFWRVS